MNLFLIRHGETEWLAEGRFQGHSPVSLNENGKKQAAEAGKYLSEQGIGAIYASALARAKETAAIISELCGIRAAEDPRLNEIDFGEWEGRRHEELAREYPEAYADWIELKWHFRPPGGESVQDVFARMHSFYHEAILKKSDVAAVSHGGPIGLLLLHLTKMPIDSFRAILPAPGTVIQILYDKGVKEILRHDSPGTKQWSRLTA